jgi:hypothetical protein
MEKKKVWTTEIQNTIEIKQIKDATDQLLDEFLCSKVAL